VSDRRLICEFAPGFTPFSSSFTWVDLSSRLREASWSIGRDDEFEHFPPGTATVVLSNRDRFLDADNAAGPWFGQLDPYVPVRIRSTQPAFQVVSWARDTNIVFIDLVTGRRPDIGDVVTVDVADATFDGTFTVTGHFGTTTITYGQVGSNVTTVFGGGTVTEYADEFYGFVTSGFEQQLAPIGSGDCKLELVDLLGVLGGYKLPHVFDHAILSQQNLKGYWVLDTTENNEQVEDLSGNDHDGNAVGPVTFGERQIHPGHGTSALFPSRDSVTPDFAKSYVDLGRSPIIAGTGMDTASVVITFIARSQASSNFRALFVHGNGSAALYDGLQAAIDTTGKLNYQWVEDNGGINYEWPIEVVDNVGHIMFGQGAGLAVDTEVLNTTTASLTLGSTNGVGIGGHRGIHGPDGFDGWICSVALYSTPLDEAARMEIHEAFHHLEGFTSDVQIGWALDRLGVPAGRRNLDVGTVVMGPADTRDRDILEFMREVTATEGGGLYVDHRDGGKIRFTNRYSRHLATRSVTSQATFTDDPSANPNVSIRYMPEGLEVAPNALDGIVNQVTVTWAGGEVIVEDTASVTAYGPRGRQVDTTATTAHQARSTGEWIIANYAQPRSRVRGAVASKGTFADRHDRVQRLRIDDRVTFRVHPQKLGAATTSTLFVDGVSHVCAGPEWRTSFRFAPGHTFTPWVWGTSQWGSNPWG
jgi:hypothetical protein